MEPVNKASFRASEYPVKGVRVRIHNLTNPFIHVSSPKTLAYL